MSLLNGVLACLSALSASCTWQAYVLALPSCFMCSRTWRALYVRWCSSQAHVLYELGLFTCLTSFMKRRPWHVSKNGVLGVLHKMVCLAYLGCFIKWCSWRALKNGVHGVLHKMTCLNLPNCFLGVFDHRVIVNYRFWMWCIQWNAGKCQTYLYNLCFCFKFRISCLSLNFYTHL